MKAGYSLAPSVLIRAWVNTVHYVLSQQSIGIHQNAPHMSQLMQTLVLFQPFGADAEGQMVSITRYCLKIGTLLLHSSPLGLYGACC